MNAVDDEVADADDAARLLSLASVLKPPPRLSSDAALFPEGPERWFVLVDLGERPMGSWK